MRPVQQLPPEYQAVGTFDIRHSRLALVWLNLGGLVLLFISFALFDAAARALNPRLAASTVSTFAWEGVLGVLVFAVSVLAINIAVVVLHEGVHGVFFWLFTRQRPVFAFRWAYASAAAPGWYIPRLPFLWVGLSPLVLLSLLGVALMPFLPPGWMPALVGFLTFNAAGAVGDLYICAWALTQPADCYVQDAGDRVSLYSAHPRQPPSQEGK
jgi:hypothetical protein